MRYFFYQPIIRRHISELGEIITLHAYVIMVTI